MIFTAMTRLVTRCVHDDDDERLLADPNIILTTTLYNYITKNPLDTSSRMQRVENIERKTKRREYSEGEIRSINLRILFILMVYYLRKYTVSDGSV